MQGRKRRGQRVGPFLIGDCVAISDKGMPLYEAWNYAERKEVIVTEKKIRRYGMRNRWRG